MSPDHHWNKGEQKETQPMKRSNKQFEKARWDRIAAGDSVYSFLVKNFAPETALAIAVTVEYFLAVRWEAEQEQMRQSRDPHRIFEISAEEMERARKAFYNTPAGLSDLSGERYVIDLLGQFPGDQAWWTAHRVKREIEGWCRLKTTQFVQEGATAGVPARTLSGITGMSM
jgi:hypothetical protein